MFPDATLAQDTLAWAREIAQSSRYAIAMSKQVFYSQQEMTEWQAYQYAKEMMALSGISPNATEGFTAFLNKRQPVWNEDSY